MARVDRDRGREREERMDLLVSGTSTLSGGPCGIYACLPIALLRLLSLESSKTGLRVKFAGVPCTVHLNTRMHWGTR